MYLYIIVIITLWTLSPAPRALKKQRRIYKPIKKLPRNAFVNNLIVYAWHGPKYISEM